MLVYAVTYFIFLVPSYTLPLSFVLFLLSLNPLLYVPCNEIACFLWLPWLTRLCVPRLYAAFGFIFAYMPLLYDILIYPDLFLNFSLLVYLFYVSPIFFYVVICPNRIFSVSPFTFTFSTVRFYVSCIKS